MIPFRFFVVFMFIMGIFGLLLVWWVDRNLEDDPR